MFTISGMPEQPAPKLHQPRPAPRGVSSGETGYAELHCRTNFSFLEGASHADELVVRAAELGYRALAVTDRNTLAGVVRAHAAAKEVGLPLIVGAQITPVDAPPVCLWASDRSSYANLCRLITLGRRRAPKGECELRFDDMAARAQGLLAGVLLREPRPPAVEDQLQRYRELFGDRCYALAELTLGPHDRLTLAHMQALADAAGLPLVAAGDVYYHHPRRRLLQDVLSAIRHRCTVAELQDRGFSNGERYLKPLHQLRELFADCPGAIERTIEIADRCRFSLEELRYDYPQELCPPEKTLIGHLRELTEAGAAERYPAGVPAKVRDLIEHELRLIGTLRYESYFLTVWDLVRFARSRGILCQGRGSAANSAVCFCLGVTSVDPDQIDVLFERFVSEERDEAPDIDIDFEHERREEVIQYIYEKYGRERSGMAATVITYRPKSAVRDVGRALGLSLDRVDELSKAVGRLGNLDMLASRFRDAGVDPTSPIGKLLLLLVKEILGFPRHLSQHVGGMVITDSPLCELVPIENAAMEGRTVIQWDKDDMDALGILKIDCLALGMLSALRKSFDLLREHYARPSPLEGEGQIRSAATDQGEGARQNNECVAIVGEVERGRRPRRAAEAAFHVKRPPKPTALLSDRRQHPGCKGPGQGGSEPHTATAEPSAWEGGPSHRERGTCRPATTLNLQLSTLNALPLTLAAIPQEDPRVYEMITRADTVGLFQVESRAQMAMHPRLRPQTFYDLVIAVAIVRPGPIQGDMVNPYLRRRAGEEAVEYPDERIRAVLHKTLGVPLFQEQAMKLAVVAAGFTPGEADQLRRAMGAWRKTGTMDQFRTKLIEGMRANGYSSEFGERLFNQIRGFGEYGFPESHAASFALLAYASAWLKCYYPAVFTTALLNSQPMGFYAPAQLLRDARGHGVEVRGVDVNFSHWDCTLEAVTQGACGRGHAPAPPHPDPSLREGSVPLPRGERDDHGDHVARPFALRLGLRMIRGLSEADAERLAQVRPQGGFAGYEDLARRTGFSSAVLTRLSKADSLASLRLNRREAAWLSLPSRRPQPLFDELESDESTPGLPPPSDFEEVAADYTMTGLSLRQHPLAFLRKRLDERCVTPAERLAAYPHEVPITVAGLVLLRQRPSTAKGVTFVTLEDETGFTNLIIYADVWERYRRAAGGAAVLLASGTLQHQNGVIHVLVQRLEDLSQWLQAVRLASRDFR
jgi:error-prone DNA polymerase